MGVVGRVCIIHLQCRDASSDPAPRCTLVGRDCIGVAKTGSGKTLAFVLPMMRHVKDQPPVVQGDGPVGLLMAPTRELVQQITKVGARVG